MRRLECAVVGVDGDFVAMMLACNAGYDVSETNIESFGEEFWERGHAVEWDAVAALLGARIRNPVGGELGDWIIIKSFIDFVRTVP